MDSWPIICIFLRCLSHNFLSTDPLSGIAMGKGVLKCKMSGPGPGGGGGVNSEVLTIWKQYLKKIWTCRIFFIYGKTLLEIYCFWENNIRLSHLSWVKCSEFTIVNNAIVIVKSDWIFWIKINRGERSPSAPSPTPLPSPGYGPGQIPRF